MGKERTRENRDKGRNNMKTIILGALKSIVLPLVSEKFLRWLILWGATAVVKKTKTTKDDELLAKIKEVNGVA